jgi:hypothetical protein
VGKKSKYKHLRRLGNDLEPIQYLSTEKHHVQGSVLIAQGMTEYEGVAIDPVKIYTQDMPVIMNVNHGRRLKKFYKQYGFKGVDAYVRGVQNHMK